MAWNQKLLRVNLKTKKIDVEPIDKERLEKYIGGRGLGISYLLEEVDPTCDPFDPGNKLIMMTGPLTGTTAPTGARYMVMTKSPLTGAITCSNSGGYFPAMLKRTGFDGLIIEDAAEEPVYLRIENGKAEIRPATHLWGKDAHETDELVRKETHPKARVACIGPAGENRVLFAGIMNDKDRTAGRSGVGAVMGAKNLKAIAVHGDQKPALHDPKAFSALVKKFLDGFKASNQGIQPTLRVYGTAITITGTQTVGALPTRNFQQGTFEHWDKIGGEALTERFLVKPKACFSCPIACGRVTRIASGPFAGEGEGPEYETIYALGSNCGISDLAALTKANYICNEMGMDTISMGSTIACAMELYERGILTEEIIGRPLPFGDGEALVEMCRLTARREGFGNQLAEGSARLAAAYGHPELAITAKKQEFAGYDPRAEKGMGLAYATSNIGASHMRGDPAYLEILGVPLSLDPLTWEDKPSLVKTLQDLFAVIDAAGLCVFFSIRNYVTKSLKLLPFGIAELLNAATGTNYDAEGLLRAGERIFNAERLFLIRAGFTKDDDTLPKRIVAEPLPDGPGKGHVCELDKMLPPYYELRGWTRDGVPTEETLTSLGIT